MKSKPEKLDVDMSRFSVYSINVSKLHSPNSSDWEYLVRAKVKDVETGEVTDIWNRQRVPYELNRDAHIRMVRAMIMTMLAHEVDECLYVDGERICADPHPELSRKTA